MKRNQACKNIVSVGKKKKNRDRTPPGSRSRAKVLGHCESIVSQSRACRRVRNQHTHTCTRAHVRDPAHKRKRAPSSLSTGDVRGCISAKTRNAFSFQPKTLSCRSSEEPPPHPSLPPLPLSPWGTLSSRQAERVAVSWRECIEGADATTRRRIRDDRGG